MALPGEIRTAHSDEVCEYEQHENDVPAVKALCTESDSFGDEWLPMCQACYEIQQSKPEVPIISVCERCNTNNIEVKPRRDPEEGTSGPVYDMCNTCYNTMMSRFSEGCEVPENERDGDMWDGLPPDEDDDDYDE